MSRNTTIVLDILLERRLCQLKAAEDLKLTSSYDHLNAAFIDGNLKDIGIRDDQN